MTTCVVGAPPSPDASPPPSFVPPLLLAVPLLPVPLLPVPLLLVLPLLLLRPLLLLVEPSPGGAMSSPHAIATAMAKKERSEAATMERVMARS
jgi:hypothetical protein